MVFPEDVFGISCASSHAFVFSFPQWDLLPQMFWWCFLACANSWHSQHAPTSSTPKYTLHKEEHKVVLNCFCAGLTGTQILLERVKEQSVPLFFFLKIEESYKSFHVWRHFHTFSPFLWTFSSSPLPFVRNGETNSVEIYAVSFVLYFFSNNS